MHNIHELEKRWLTYKIKSYMPVTIITLSIITTLIIFLNFDIKEEVVNTPKIEIIKKVITAKVELKEIPKPVEKPVQKTIEVPKPIIYDKPSEKIILSPSLDFIKKLRSSSRDSYKQQSFQNTQNRKFKKQEIEEKIVEEKTIEPEEVEQKAIMISKRETESDIKHVIKRFKKNNNPALSLFVAKKYYKIGEYRKAYNYALLTNEINNDIEESWIVFAKSLVKVGQRDKAIKTLIKYIKYSDSSNAKVLLDDIKSGKFR